MDFRAPLERGSNGLGFEFHRSAAGTAGAPGRILNGKTAVNHLIRSALLTFSALCLISPGAAHASEPYQKTPDGIVVYPAAGPAKRVRLQVMSDRVIRVTAVPTQALDLPKSLMVTATPTGNVPFTV